MESRGHMHSKTILVTGGTGSFGHTFINQALQTDVHEIRCFSRDEMKQQQMKNLISDSRLRFYLGDIRDYDAILPAIDGVDYVFHAAALKQVPFSEAFPLEYIKTNILGSANLIRALSKNPSVKSVFLSTDKAVEPLNMMGITKAAMEKLVFGEADLGNLSACVTRYGNVMGSRGSVIPLFIKLIKSGQPVQITDFAMTRFMMSLGDSVELVMHALTNGSNGELFVQKSPAASVRTILEALCLLYKNVDIQKIVVGYRPGEKTHETLLTAEEMSRSVESDRYFQVKKVPMVRSAEDKSYTSFNTTQLSAGELAQLIEETPETRTLL